MQARALTEPKLLLADEPTTALDATVQIQVLLLLRRLREEFGMAIMFVTRDIGVAAEIADRVVVMYAGRIVEEGGVGDVLSRPLHPYTMGLLASSVENAKPGEEIAAIAGARPDLRNLPCGCAFSPGCIYAVEACTQGIRLPTVLRVDVWRFACPQKTLPTELHR